MTRGTKERPRAEPDLGVAQCAAGKTKPLRGGEIPSAARRALVGASESRPSQGRAPFSGGNSGAAAGEDVARPANHLPASGGNIFRWRKGLRAPADALRGCQEPSILRRSLWQRVQRATAHDDDVAADQNPARGSGIAFRHHPQLARPADEASLAQHEGFAGGSKAVLEASCRSWRRRQRPHPLTGAARRPKTPRVTLGPMSQQPPEDPDAPVWGADGWPRQIEGGLDEGDRLHLLSMLELTPMQRLRSLENFVNGIARIRRGRVSSD